MVWVGWLAACASQRERNQVERKFCVAKEALYLFLIRLMPRTCCLLSLRRSHFSYIQMETLPKFLTFRLRDARLADLSAATFLSE